MNIEQSLKKAIQEALLALYQVEEEVILQPTKKDFEGNYTFVVFPLVKSLRKNPVELGNAIGQYLKDKNSFVSGFNVVQGFLNIVLDNGVWIDTLNAILADDSFGQLPSNGQSVMVEFSSPNTNKPLHLGHLRNNFLGESVSSILKAGGFEVIKTSLVNDRGIHICKSMLAYQKFGNNETPESLGMKGDHLVGKYYVEFDKAYKAEINQLVAEGKTEDEAKKIAPLMLEAQAMLQKWEQGDAEVMALWRKMNDWVFAGFNETYQKIGVSFDKVYYESNTYLLGKDLVEEGLASGVFFKKENGSTWIDLKEEGLDEKLVLRADGTSVYITQDLGTTDMKFNDFHNDKSIWVVGNEQDYHFQVLFAIMKRLGRSYADGCYHLSYGMVDLPSGKMKSREGTVVDADDLVAEMIETAAETTRERGKIDDFTKDEAENLFQMLALGALKYFLLKVEPKKRMLFNPAESIDFQGNTGPFIQYTHARICSILRKAEAMNVPVNNQVKNIDILKQESELIYLLNEYPTVIQKACNEYSPAVIANYVYELAKTFNQFYAEVSIMNETDADKQQFRLSLIKTVAQTISKSMSLLGVQVPTRM
ncbi:Arginyl-tRNA synthetase [Emticicia oligotrophica DSM 17448]|uniref:Arginine--tRNA ligase n=1 Tax=Emticicia oligotrophica (strain DSM 17448 / CIP 109782 / MTCC 6937 / GPTSA100-15) TaxID=929562 RepID=A0ABM5N5C2_EMTOG|nr:arginine--tRNA ligase [Emticicia oligotrophica]AFK04634.1 Arginyl-tRNA synthetase [Emticicia oligotrophica DSM 17448]